MDDEVLLMLVGRFHPGSLLDLHWFGAVVPESAEAIEVIRGLPIPTQEKYQRIVALFTDEEGAA